MTKERHTLDSNTETNTQFDDNERSFSVSRRALGVTAALAISAPFGLSAEAQADYSPYNVHKAYDAAMAMVHQTPPAPGTDRAKELSFAQFYDNAATSVYWQPFRVYKSKIRSGTLKATIDANNKQPSRLKVSVNLDKQWTSPLPNIEGVVDDGYFDPMNGERSLEKSNIFAAYYSPDDIVDRDAAVGVYTKTAHGTLKPFKVKRGGKIAQLTAPIKLPITPSPTDKLASFTSQQQYDDERAAVRAAGPSRASVEINVGARGLEEIRRKRLVFVLGAHAIPRSPYLGKEKPLKQGPMVGYFVPSKTKAKQILSSDRVERSLKKLPPSSQLTRFIHSAK